MLPSFCQRRRKEKGSSTPNKQHGSRGPRGGLASLTSGGESRWWLSPDDTASLCVCIVSRNGSSATEVRGCKHDRMPSSASFCSKAAASSAACAVFCSIKKRSIYFAIANVTNLSLSPRRQKRGQGVLLIVDFLSSMYKSAVLSPWIHKHINAYIDDSYNYYTRAY